MLMWEMGLYKLNVSGNTSRRVRNSAAGCSRDNIQVALICSERIVATRGDAPPL